MSFVLHSSAKAADLTSTNFIIRDPVIGTGGGYSSSGSFQLFSEGHDSFSDRNNSSSFLGRYGFLYYEDEAITPPPPPGGGGGGGGDDFSTGVRFTGRAYPFSRVVLLKEGDEVQSVTANFAGYFNIGLEENTARSIVYTLYAIDVLGNKSLLINYPVVVKIDSVAYLSGVLFVPTINTDKSVVKYGDFLTVSGYAIQNKELEIIVEDGGRSGFTTVAGNDGYYELSIPMGQLQRGEYKVYVKYQDDPRFSKLIRFVIGDVNVFNKEQIAELPGDCNFDKNINLVDFSILAFWYGKDNPPECVDTNKDRIINLVDFSILAFYWTG